MTDKSWLKYYIGSVDMLSASGVYIYPLTASSYYGLMSNPECGDMPLLTPLAKMSEEDAKELVCLSDIERKVSFEIFSILKYGIEYYQPFYSLYTVIRFDSLNTAQHDFLDRRGYDQRNLIEAGLALDKTIYSQENKEK